MRRISLAPCLFVLVGVWPATAQQRIANGPHDLSTHGPGPTRAIDEERICIFCHAPHNTQPATPLWNRHNPTTHYRIYRSSTTDARIDQPSGPSKMCLSCHDGSLAIGLVRSQPATDPIVVNTDTMPPGPTNLTNDLSDDHPIGFRYDRALSNTDRQLRDPQSISSLLKLGPHNQVHCSTCHDPHDNGLGNFLRITDRGGAICTTCHKLDGWQLGAHARSTRHIRSRLNDPRQQVRYATMRDNACLACHQIHTAEGRQRLLRFARLEDNCLACHDGSVATDIAAVIGRRSNHRGTWGNSGHDPTEPVRPIRAHVECVDCHNPHAAQPGRRGTLARQSAITVPGPMLGVPGINIRGRTVNRPSFYYEICLRCHSDRPVRIKKTITRTVNTPNLRLRISPTAASSHPIAVRNRGGQVPSILPAFRGRRISCQDCHNVDDAEALGDLQPNGPHGSSNPFLLTERYNTQDFTTESTGAYALCYQCHDRNSLLNDESFTLHRSHIVNNQAPCSACHAPHGVRGSTSEHSHLINFDRSIVRPVSSPTGSGLNFRDLGRFQGSCTLRCHGVNHVRFRYPP